MTLEEVRTNHRWRHEDRYFGTEQSPKKRPTVNIQLNKLIIEQEKINETGFRPVEQWLLNKAEPEEDKQAIVWLWKMQLYQKLILSQHWILHQLSLSNHFINTFHLKCWNLVQSWFRWKILSYNKSCSFSLKYAFPSWLVKSSPCSSKEPGTLHSNKNVGIPLSLNKPSTPSSL